LWPTLRPQKLAKTLKAAVVSLGVGEVSSVIRSGNKLVIVKVVERDESGIPSFKESTGTLGQRAQMQKMEQARRKWLDGLRTRAHVELRL
jgi:parvulin-like peptidyl-prolyl isomerase